jgi:hypothetical protein
VEVALECRFINKLPSFTLWVVARQDSTSKKLPQPNDFFGVEAGSNMIDYQLHMV